MTTVAEIFDKAERFFEVRVAQLLEEKRLKAIENGTILNARKAKRDARTAAGREKLDALVRRLADLAIIQERIIRDHCPDQTLVRNALEQHTRRLWLLQNAAPPQISLVQRPTSIQPSLQSLQPPPIQPSLMLPLSVPTPHPHPHQHQHFHPHTHQHPHQHPHTHTQSIFGHPPPPQIMPASPYTTSIVIRQQQIQQNIPPYSSPPPPPPLSLPVHLQSFEQVLGMGMDMDIAGTRHTALNPNADPWEAKPPSPRPTLPPPLPLFDIDDDEFEDDVDVSTPIFPATESVLQHLGPDFEDEMDEYSPCSILDIGSSPLHANNKNKKKLAFDY